MGRKSRAKKERREKQKQAEQGIIEINGQSLQKGDEQELLEKVPAESGNTVEEQIARVLAILGVSDEDEADVNDENLDTYFDYLQEHLEIPCTVTGIEDMGCFGWEEYYTFGPGSKREHEKLKKQRPSYTDDYELLEFSDEFDEDEGIFVHVKRLSDKKKFTLPLADLEGVDEHSKQAQIINDYVMWFVNYR